MGYYSWIYLMTGIGAKTDVELYRSTYTSLAGQNPGNSVFAAQLAAYTMRGNAEQRLKQTLEVLRAVERTNGVAWKSRV